MLTENWACSQLLATQNSNTGLYEGSLEFELVSAQVAVPTNYPDSPLPLDRIRETICVRAPAASQPVTPLERVGMHSRTRSSS